jgi:putative ABC transport system permease protein
MKDLRVSLTMALAYLREKKLATLLNVVLLGLGVATIIALLLLMVQTEERMERDAAGIDLVIGAKGSPMQLILSSIFHVDVPTGNVPIDEAAQIISEPAVKRAIPLALGDSFRSFRIVGTNPNFLELYDGQLSAGRMWDKPLEAVVGADVVRATSGAAGGGTGGALAIGKQFAGTHGLSDAGGSAHADHPYTVVGHLAPTGTVMDRLILTSVASVWAVHGHGDGDDDTANDNKPGHEGHDHGKSKEVTAYLVQYATPLAAASFPRLVNSSSSMQAASPAMESARLFQLVGVGVAALKGFAVIMMLCAALGIFIGLTNALDERRADLALLRVLGATPAVIVLSTMIQGLLLGMLGVILGLLLGHLGAEWVGQTYAASQRVAIGGRVWVAQEWWVVGSAIGLAAIAAMVPSWRAYRQATPELLATR